MLYERGWPVDAVDLGNVPQIVAPAGPVDCRITRAYQVPLCDEGDGQWVKRPSESARTRRRCRCCPTLDEFALNKPKPRVVSRRPEGPRRKYPGETKSWQLAKSIRVSNVNGGRDGGAGAVGLRADQEERPVGQFGRLGAGPQGGAEGDERGEVDLPMLLYMGTIARDCAMRQRKRWPAQAFPQFPLIAAVDETDWPRSSRLGDQPKTGAKTMLVALGHKGKAVGVVGVFRTGKADQPFELQYQLVEMSPKLRDAADQKGGPPSRS